MALLCLALLALGLVNLLAGLVLGAGEAPSTRLVLEAVHANFAPFGWGLIVCASVVTGRVDWTPLALAAVLCGVALGALTAGGVLGVGFQAVRGGVIEPWLYLHGLYFNLGWPALHLAGLAACVQGAVRRPWLGAVIVGAGGLGLHMVFDHPLLAPGAPVSPWSQMNGYGPFLGPQLAAGVFWTAVTALALLGVSAWRRKRVDQGSVVGAWIAVVTAVLCAAWHLQQAPPNPPAIGEGPAHGPQPAYTRLDLVVDMDVAAHRLRSQGTAVVVNPHDRAIPVLHFGFHPAATARQLRLTGTRLPTPQPHCQSHRLNRPLAPKETLKITFDITRAEHRFDPRQQLLANGASARLGDLVPSLGCHPTAIDAAAATRLRIRIGTRLDQIAIAPGRLTGQWRENGRAFFAYAADAPVPLSATVHSGRYATTRAMWGDVAIHVYHHPAHAWRVPAMLAQAERALAGWPRGDYPYRWLHMVETPDYRPVARPPSMFAFGWRAAASARVDMPSTQAGVLRYSEHLPGSLGCRSRGTAGEGTRRGWAPGDGLGAIGSGPRPAPSGACPARRSPGRARWPVR